MPFDLDVESVTPIHECCSVCEQDCKCSSDRCSRIHQPFDPKNSDNSTTYTSLFKRNVYPEDKEALRSALIGLKEQFDSTGLSAFDLVSTHGFLIELIEAIVSDCAHCATLDYLMASFPLFYEEHTMYDTNQKLVNGMQEHRSNEINLCLHFFVLYRKILC